MIRKNMNKKRILWITQTAIFIALLLAVQIFTRPFGQIVTGSCINFILVSSCILGGMPSAAIVAIVSPVCAFMLIGIPAFPILIPFMMAGNFVLVAVIHFISGKAFIDINSHSNFRIYASAVTGAILKFLTLWIGILQIALSFIPDISQPQKDVMAVTFSWPQLVTALIGSSFAVTITPKLMKYLHNHR